MICFLSAVPWLNCSQQEELLRDHYFKVALVWQMSGLSEMVTSLGVGECTQKYGGLPIGACVCRTKRKCFKNKPYG